MVNQVTIIWLLFDTIYVFRPEYSDFVRRFPGPKPCKMNKKGLLGEISGRLHYYLYQYLKRMP